MRLVIVGGGSVGKRHLANFRDLGVEALAAVDTRSDRRQEIVDRFDNVAVYENLSDALAEGYEAVVVCTPTARHTETATRSLESGAHVLIEKPISNSVTGVSESLRLAEQRDLVYMVGYTYRFWPPLLAAEQLLSQGAIGRPLFADVTFAQYLPDWHPWEDYRSWFMSQREQGGGALLDESHAIDIVRWFFGEVTDVFCLTGNLSSLEMSADDHAQFVLRMASGVLATVHLDVFARQPRRTIDVSGETGNLHVDVSSGQIAVFDAESKSLERISVACDRNEMFVKEASHFLACIRGEAAPCVGGEDALRTLQICLAGVESSAVRRMLSLSTQPSVAGT